MNKINVRGCGNLHVISRKDGRGYRLLNKFLKELMTETVRKSYSFYDNTRYMPFAFKERQLHSVLCPALFDVTGSALMEVPL